MYRDDGSGLPPLRCLQLYFLRVLLNFLAHFLVRVFQASNEFIILLVCHTLADVFSNVGKFRNGWGSVFEENAPPTAGVTKLQSCKRIIHNYVVPMGNGLLKCSSVKPHIQTKIKKLLEILLSI